MGTSWKMKAVADSGPIIHLAEIDCLKALKIFKTIIIPEEVLNELSKKKENHLNKLKNIKSIQLQAEYKDNAKIFSEEYELHLGEAEAIALAIQEKINLFLTDDLEARTTAKEYHLEVHGTVGIILRAFKENVLTKEETIKKVNELHKNSSLFITKDLIDYIQREIHKVK